MDDRQVDCNSRVLSLVHFFGPDGAGKSKQADILVDFLDKRGLKIRKSWLRAHHTLAFVLWKLLVRIGFYRVVSNPLGVATRLPSVDRGKFLRCFWSLVEFVSVLPIVLHIRLFILRGYQIVAERYILDTVTAIAYIVNDPEFLKSRISRMLFRLIPRNTAFIFLDSDYETIRRRRAPSSVTVDNALREQTVYRFSEESYVEPQDYIEFQRTAYRILAKSFKALIIDTSRASIEETSEKILKHLELI